MLRPILVALSTLTIAGLASASPPNTPIIQWAESWQAAVEEAKERNVPILITFHTDG
jgi:hypothetical protein